MRKPFTGKHMTAILVAGFGVVFAVNMAMAALASSTFGGVVVENSYVASQKFNGWLAEAERVDSLGWDIAAQQSGDGRVVVMAGHLPGTATVRAMARHPLGRHEDRMLTFTDAGDGRYISREALPETRWTLRLEVNSAGEVWRGERALR